MNHSSGAGRKVIQLVSVVLIVCVVLAYHFLRSWYQAHPVLGKIILGIIVCWAVYQAVLLFRSFNDDPLTRTTPYKRD